MCAAAAAAAAAAASEAAGADSGCATGSDSDLSEDLSPTSVHPEATKGERRDVRQLQPEGSSTEGRGGVKGMSPEG